MTGTKRQRAAERRRLAERRKTRNRLLTSVAALLSVVALVTFWPSGEPAEGSVELEAWDLPSLENESRVTLSEFNGKPTVAAFFASWCHVCQRELPGFAALSHELGDQVHFVGINTMNNGTGLAFAHQTGISHWPLARDIGGVDGRQLATNFGAVGSPTTVIYDESGVVVDVTLGGMTASQLAAKLTQFFGVD